jgi:hypothetical protein
MLDLTPPTPSTALAYDGGMQALQLVLLTSGVTLGAAWLAARLARRPDSSERWPAVVIGVASGLIGATFVAVLAFDTVPDAAERVLRTVAIVGVSGAVIVGSIYRLSRR